MERPRATALELCLLTVAKLAPEAPDCSLRAAATTNPCARPLVALLYCFHRCLFTLWLFRCRSAPSCLPATPASTAKFSIASNKTRAWVVGGTAFQYAGRSASVRSKRGWDCWPPGGYAGLLIGLCGSPTLVRTSCGLFVRAPSRDCPARRRSVVNLRVHGSCFALDADRIAASDRSGCRDVKIASASTRECVGVSVRLKCKRPPARAEGLQASRGTSALSDARTVREAKRSAAGCRASKAVRLFQSP